MSVDILPGGCSRSDSSVKIKLLEIKITRPKNKPRNEAGRDYGARVIFVNVLVCPFMFPQYFMESPFYKGG
jgi:hypothetical protein